MKAIIFGAPGSGKGTYSSRLQSKLSVDVISMGDIFRKSIKDDSELGRKVKNYVEKGILVPDEVVVQVLIQQLSEISNGKGFILDGYPRTLDQAKKLDAVTKIDAILLLNVPDRIIIERLSTRRICKKCGTVYNTRFLRTKIEDVCDKCGGPLYQRSDDIPEVIKKRLQVYQEQTNPLIDFYRKKQVPFIVSNTTSLKTPPDLMVDEMVAALKKLKLV